MEEDVFRTIIPLIPHAGDHGENEDERTKEILEFCSIPRSGTEIQEFIEVKSRRYFRQKILNSLIKGGLLKLTLPDKPTSPKQKYYA